MYNPSSLPRKVSLFVALLFWPENANPTRQSQADR